MSEVDKKLRELIEAMRHSDEYRRYRELEAQLQVHPDVKKAVNEYRSRVFEMQNSNRDIFDETDYMTRDFERLTKNPLAADYLDAESAVCAMLRKVTDAISEEVIVSLPDS